MSFLSFAQCVGVTQLVSGFLSEDTALYVAGDSVCPWEEMSLGACCHHHLELDHYKYSGTTVF